MAKTEAELKDFAKTLRGNPSEWEKRLWRSLSASKLGGFKFRRQHVIDRYVCDFFCPAIGLVVEIDGREHDTVADARRDRHIASKGFAVIRFANHDLRENFDGVLESILLNAQSLPPRWPHPNPSPEGEGLKKKAFLARKGER